MKKILFSLILLSQVSYGADFTVQFSPEDNSISTVKLQDNSVSTVKIQDGAVTASKIANGSIDDSKVSSISSSKISDLSQALPQVVSSDSLTYVFKASAITDSDPIGTYNTYSYAPASNTPSLNVNNQSVQSSADMALNGIRIHGRAYSSGSVAGQPNRIEIKIGKNLKSLSVQAYGGANKVNSLSYDQVIWDSNTSHLGTMVVYDATTGILVLNAGQAYSSANTTRFVGRDYNNGGSYPNAYFVFSALKIP